MSSRFKSFVWNWLPVALWLAIIAIESTNLLSARNTGNLLYEILKAVFGPINHHKFDVLHAVLRKIGHFVGYGVLGLLFFRAVRRSFLQSDSSAEDLTCTPERCASFPDVRTVLRRSANIAVVCTAAVASADELHQSLLPSRTGALHDVALDTMGAVVLLIFVLSRYSRRLRDSEAD